MTRAATAAAARGADVVISMLPNGAILRAVAAEVIPAMTRGGAVRLLDRGCGQRARRGGSGRRSGPGALDAPVSGGIGGAAAGTLTFMVGGTDEAFATVAPLFGIMGQKAVHCGVSGAGQAARSATT